MTPYRADPKERVFKKEALDEVTKIGVTKPAYTEWDAPIFFAHRKDGILWFLVDYCKLNSVSVCDAYPIRQMDQFMDSLVDSKVPPTLKAAAGIERSRSPRWTEIRVPSTRTLQIGACAIWDKACYRDVPPSHRRDTVVATLVTLPHLRR